MEHTRTDFTPYMKEIIGGVIEKIETFYCKEDFVSKLHEIASQNEKSGHESRLKELKEMCAISGLDWNLLCDKKTCATELHKTPTRNDLKKTLIKELHNIFLEFPTSTQFMERLIRRRLGQEFKENTLRLAILKQFIKNTDYHTKPVIELVENLLSEEEKRQYSSMNKQAKKEFILSHLNDDIFNVLTCSIQRLDPVKWLEFILKRIKDYTGKFETTKYTTEQLKEFLYSLKSEETFKDGISGVSNVLCEILNTININGIDEEKSNELESMIKLVEGEFCTYLKSISHKMQNGEIEAEYERYKQAKKDFKKLKNKDWELLKLADDLGTGKFRVNGKTREQLYIFAIAFDMKVYFGKKDEIYDENRDLEKNLFGDYYNDNLLRYILDEEYIEKSSNYEAEPSGEGINYKNYVEVIYIYYIYRNDLGLDHKDKIKRAQFVIEKCVKTAKNHIKRVQSAPKNETIVYKSNLLEEVLNIKEESKLIEHICENYYVYDSKLKVARILFASEQNTAIGYHSEIVEKIQKEFPGVDLNEEFDYGIDVDWLLNDLKGSFEQDEELMKILENDKKFINLLQKLDEKLHTCKKGILELNKETRKSDRTRFTRTEIITLYYCYFQIKIDDLAIKSLPELYIEFCDGINPYLEKCRYQKINEKNAFDMFVIFSLFLEQLN